MSVASKIAEILVTWSLIVRADDLPFAMAPRMALASINGGKREPNL